MDVDADAAERGEERNHLNMAIAAGGDHDNRNKRKLTQPRPTSQ